MRTNSAAIVLTCALAHGMASVRAAGPQSARPQSADPQSAILNPQSSVVTGVVRDQTGGALPGVTVELTTPRTAPLAASTDANGRYRFGAVPPGTYALSFRLLNFGDQQRRDLQVAGGQTVTADA